MRMFETVEYYTGTLMRTHSAIQCLCNVWETYFFHLYN